MKKVFVTAVITAAFAGLSLAQSNSSTSTQNGGGNEVTVTQTGSSTSTAMQTGDNNSAAVTQQGADHLSTISQNTWGEGHTATVIQTGGNKNSSDILQDQRTAAASVTQTGSENVSGLKQSGPNEAVVSQQGDQNVLGSYSAFSGRAFQKNGTSFANDKNWLDLSQTGNRNRAGLWQEHHAEALIVQTGDDNTAGVNQTSSPAGGDINSAEMFQYGNDNIGDIGQRQENQYASLTQTGDANEASAGQSGGDNNRSISTQNGSDNYAATLQTGPGNLARVGQNGSGNDAEVTQNAAQFYNDAEVIQQGSGNFAVIEQINDYVHGTAASLFTARQEQLGDDNRADIYQQGFRWGTNSAEQFQDGNDNTATINQLAAAASGAKETQIGFNNEAWIQQGPDLSKTSSINYGYAEIQQLGSESYSRIDQTGGNKLRAYSTQNGFGNKSEISQTGIYAPPGIYPLGNTATVIQNGAGSGSAFVNVSSILQNGDGNNAVITQTAH